MLLKMHNKFFDGILGAICGVFGYGITLTNITWTNDLLRMLVSMVSAFLAGLVGYLGKRAGSWAIRKVKSLRHQNPNDKS
jgi:hypothetical protein